MWYQFRTYDVKRGDQQLRLSGPPRATFLIDISGMQAPANETGSTSERFDN